MCTFFKHLLNTFKMLWEFQVFIQGINRDTPPPSKKIRLTYYCDKKLESYVNAESHKWVPYSKNIEIEILSFYETNYQS